MPALDVLPSAPVVETLLGSTSRAAWPSRLLQIGAIPSPPPCPCGCQIPAWRLGDKVFRPCPTQPFLLTDLLRLPSQALSADEKLLLFVFNGYEGPNSRGIFPGLERLARQCARSVNHVRKVIRGLARKGVVSVLERKTAHGDHDTNLYTIHIEALLAVLGAELWSTSCLTTVVRPTLARSAAAPALVCEIQNLPTHPVLTKPTPVSVELQPNSAMDREVRPPSPALVPSPVPRPAVRPERVNAPVEVPASVPAVSVGSPSEREWRKHTEQLWQQAWRRSYSADYTPAREDQGRLAFLAKTALEKAQKRGDELASQGAEPEPLLGLASAYLRHIFGAYLLNPGSQRRPDEPGFLRERRHPLRHLVDDLHAYRDPWFNRAPEARRLPVDAPGLPVQEATAEKVSRTAHRPPEGERAGRLPAEAQPPGGPASAPAAQVVPLVRPMPAASPVSSVIPAMVAAAAMAVVAPGASAPTRPASAPDVLATAAPSTPPEFSSSLDALVARTAGAMALESAGHPRGADVAEVCSLDELRRRMPGVPDDELVMLLQAEKRRLRMLEATRKEPDTPGGSSGKKA